MCACFLTGESTDAGEGNKRVQSANWRVVRPLYALLHCCEKGRCSSVQVLSLKTLTSYFFLTWHFRLSLFFLMIQWLHFYIFNLFCVLNQTLDPEQSTVLHCNQIILSVNGVQSLNHDSETFRATCNISSAMFCSQQQLRRCQSELNRQVQQSSSVIQEKVPFNDTSKYLALCCAFCSRLCTDQEHYCFCGWYHNSL